MSIVSSEEDPFKDKNESGYVEQPKLIDARRNTKSGNNDTSQNTSGKVDFFNDRDYYKIFLETSKEQEVRLR